MYHWIRPLSLLLPAALVLAGCPDDDDDSAGIIIDGECA